MNVPAQLLSWLRKEKSFFLATHINPDGDALGSTLALSFALESLGKETVLYNRDSVPVYYHFLPGRERFTSSLLPGHSSLILLDCNEPERAGLEDFAIPFSVVIDHHETVKNFGDIRWIEPHAAATGILIYHLIRGLGVTITKDMATNLFTAIAVDTGTFRYSNTTPEVFRICGELVEYGADPASISFSLYETWSEGRFRLLISVLDTLEIIGDVALTYVSREMFAATGTAPEDAEHFSNFPRMMGNIKVSAFFREIDDGWKVSLRSRGDMNVAKIAESFMGGGHRNAAGYKTKLDLRTAKDALLQAIRSL